MTPTVCVLHRAGWCALKVGTMLDPNAISDATACGHFVMMRLGSESPECAEMLEIRRAKKVGI